MLSTLLLHFRWSVEKTPYRLGVNDSEQSLVNDSQSIYRGFFFISQYFRIFRLRTNRKKKNILGGIKMKRRITAIIMAFVMIATTAAFVAPMVIAEGNPAL